MKNTTTIDAEVLARLRNLVDEIDREESTDDPNVDVVVENMYQVLDLVRTLVS